MRSPPSGRLDAGPAYTPIPPLAMRPVAAETHKLWCEASRRAGWGSSPRPVRGGGEWKRNRRWSPRHSSTLPVGGPGGATHRATPRNANSGYKSGLRRIATPVRRGHAVPASTRPATGHDHRHLGRQMQLQATVETGWAWRQAGKRGGGRPGGRSGTRCRAARPQPRAARSPSAARRPREASARRDGPPRGCVRCCGSWTVGDGIAT